MFKTSITSTPFTSEAANSFFQNITGSYFGNDCSFLSTLRALVAPRIKEDESVYLTFGSTNYDGNTIRNVPAERAVSAICSSYQMNASGALIVHSFNADQNSNLACMQIVEDKFTSIYPEYHRLDKVKAFYRKSFNVDCYINPDKKSVIVFVDNLDVKKMHYLQVSILAFMPWYLNQDDGLTEDELALMQSFEQVVNTQTDTTIYAFNKLVSLLLNCNPNTIEMLGCKPEHYFYISDIGREMIANRKMFLSKRAVHSFGGYANQQLRRLENALARDRLSQARREEHILNSMKGAVKSFESRYTIFENGSIVLYTDESPREDLDREIFADIQLKKYPVREFNSVINDLTNVIGTYEKLNHRNHKKDDEHLNKHAMHLIRLYLLCLDILEKEDIVTYRGDDLPLLMSIRKGDYQLEDGTYRPEFFEMVSDFEKRLNYAKQNTSLPDTPDMKKVEEFVMSVNRRAIDA